MFSKHMQCFVKHRRCIQSPNIQFLHFITLAFYFMSILLIWNSIGLGSAEMETKLLDSLSLVTHL